MASAGAHPYHPEWLSVAGDAWLFDTGAGRAGFRTAAAPSRIGKYTGKYRSRRRCTTAVAGLCGARSRIHHPRREAEDHCVFDLRSARRPVLRDAAAGRALQGRLDLCRAGAKRATVAIRAPCRGIDRMDRSFGAGDKAAGNRRGSPPAPCRLPDVGHRMAGAPRLPRRGNAQSHHQWKFRIDQSSRPGFCRVVGLLPLCRPQRTE